MEQTQTAVYAGDGAAVGKWFSSKGKATKFHLIGKLSVDAWTTAVCGSRFGPSFEFSPRWQELGGHKCPKCEAKS